MAKRLQWFLNAARRTLVTAVPSLAATDDDFAASLLSAEELALFMRLTAPEREHATAVARCVAGKEPAATRTVLRAALLHDVGKLGSEGNVAWRVVAHLLPGADLPAEPRVGGLAGTRQAKRHHAAYGERLILAAGGDPEVARLVGRHHAPGSDPEASRIASCDDLT